MLTNLATWIQEFHFKVSQVQFQVQFRVIFALVHLWCDVLHIPSNLAALPLLWLVRLLLLVSACLLSVLHSLVAAAQFCLSVQVWLLRLLSLPRAFLGALRAFSHSSKAFYAFPSFIEEDFLGAVAASKGRQIVLDSGCSASTTNSESYFAGSFNKIARTLRFLVGSVFASAEGHYYKGGNSSLARYMREGQSFRVAFNFLSCFSRP